MVNNRRSLHLRERDIYHMLRFLLGQEVVHVQDSRLGVRRPVIRETVRWTEGRQRLEVRSPRGYRE